MIRKKGFILTWTHAKRWRVSIRCTAYAWADHLDVDPGAGLTAVKLHGLELCGWVRGIKFAGVDNFIRLFHDDAFMKSLLNNLLFIITVPITIIVALLLAILIDKQVFLKDLFKVIYFLPYISSVVAIAMVWQVMFHPSLGPVNQFLMSLGWNNPPKWLADIHYALPSLMLIQVWIQLGYNIIIFIAGLQSIPKDLYEAADIDGANVWRKFRNITVPCISPTTFFLLVTGVIGSFKIFDLIQVLTQGGWLTPRPLSSTSYMIQPSIS